MPLLYKVNDARILPEPENKKGNNQSYDLAGLRYTLLFWYRYNSGIVLELAIYEFVKLNGH